MVRLDQARSRKRSVFRPNQQPYFTKQSFFDLSTQHTGKCKVMKVILTRDNSDVLNAFIHSFIHSFIQDKTVPSWFFNTLSLKIIKEMKIGSQLYSLLVLSNLRAYSWVKLKKKNNHNNEKKEKKKKERKKERERTEKRRRRITTCCCWWLAVIASDLSLYFNTQRRMASPPLLVLIYEL